MVVKLQEEVEQKTFNIVVSTTKLTARTILNAGRTALQQYQSKLLADKSSGKQSVRMLLRQNRGVSSVEIDKTNIKGFERYAKKYGIDYAIRKDSSEVPPRYLVFFKAPDVEAFNAAFKEYSASLLSKTKRPSVLEKLHELVQAAAELPGKVRHKQEAVSYTHLDVYKRQIPLRTQSDKKNPRQLCTIEPPGPDGESVCRRIIIG